MVFIYFSGFDAVGNFRTCSYGGPDMEACLDALTSLVNAGWQLHKVVLRQDRKTTGLPVEAFGGEPMGNAIKNLTHTWQQILI